MSSSSRWISSHLTSWITEWMTNIIFPLPHSFPFCLKSTHLPLFLHLTSMLLLASAAREISPVKLISFAGNQNQCVKNIQIRLAERVMKRHIDWIFRITLAASIMHGYKSGSAAVIRRHRRLWMDWKNTALLSVSTSTLCVNSSVTITLSFVDLLIMFALILYYTRSSVQTNCTQLPWKFEE